MTDGGPGDGRFIDPELGSLFGEGSGQRVGSREETSSARDALWKELPTHAYQKDEPTYYDRPILKEPVWIWAVPVYFYVGGTAGAAAVLAAAAHAVDRERLQRLVRSARWIAAIGGGVGSVLLIVDLGRPERFLHMLRVFRPTSPMSVGSWVLAVAASATMGSALLSKQRGFLGLLGNLSGYLAALFGMPLSGYTAVLLANTAVPVWQSARTSLPPLFVGSSISGLASLFGLLPGTLSPREEKIVERFGKIGKVADLAAMTAVERDADRIEAVGRPLREGLSGSLWKAAKVATAASLALSFLPGRSPAKRVASGLLGTAGALALRFALFYAGKASVRDPRTTFRSQRMS